MSADPNRKELVQLVGDFAGTSGSPREAKRLMERCPLVLRWNWDKKHAEQVRELLQQAGATVEIRVMRPTAFRFLD
jgi:hypothetical protein